MAAVLKAMHSVGTYNQNGAWQDDRTLRDVKRSAVGGMDRTLDEALVSREPRAGQHTLWIDSCDNLCIEATLSCVQETDNMIASSIIAMLRQKSERAVFGSQRDRRRAADREEGHTLT